MNNLDKLIGYDFHDSLLESIEYDKGKKKVTIEIDFCNWKQEWYNQTDEETSIIFLVFENVSNVSIPEFEVNSDEIIEFELLEKGVKIIVFNDIDNNSYEIIVNAKCVKITAENEAK